MQGNLSLINVRNGNGQIYNSDAPKSLEIVITLYVYMSSAVLHLAHTKGSLRNSDPKPRGWPPGGPMCGPNGP